MIRMNSPQTKRLQLKNILSYFEKENLHIRRELVESLNEFKFNIESLAAYKPYFKDILDNKVFHFQQLEVSIQYINEIKNLYLDLERIYQRISEDYNKILQMLNNISDIILKVPYVSSVRTTLKREVKRVGRDHFYMINHLMLIQFLNNIKNLVEPIDSYDLQNSPVSEIFDQIIKIIPSIKEEYLPNVLYLNVPDSVEQIIVLGENLRSLFPFLSFSFLEEIESLLEFMELVNNEFYKIENYYKTNQDKNSKKVKGKFKNALYMLDRTLSFSRYWKHV